MKRQRLITTHDPHFDSAWDLYQQSFPEDERRLLETQAIVMNNDKFHCDVIVHNSKFTGILFWWDFEKLRYIEHLATLPAMRGKGIGAQAIDKFLRENNIPVILDVEKPENDLQIRRIKFYQRLSFKLNPHFHQQPPYKPEGNSLEMLLMSHPTYLKDENVHFFHEECHPIIHFNVLGDKL